MSDGIVDTTEALVFDLVKTVMFLPPHTWRRVRFAVSLEEIEAIRKYIVKRDGKCFDRIRDVPLVVELDPLNPTVSYIAVS